MILTLLLYVIFSVIIVVSFHFIYNFGIDNYTTKKIKYLGQFQNQKYQEIIDELKKTKNYATQVAPCSVKLRTPPLGAPAFLPKSEISEAKSPHTTEAVFEDTNDYVSDLQKKQLEESLMNFIKSF